MALSLEKAVKTLDIVYLTLKNTGGSPIEIVDYFIDRYKSIGVYLRIEPDSIGVLGAHVDPLEKGRQYQVWVKTKAERGLEGPFKVDV